MGFETYLTPIRCHSTRRMGAFAFGREAPPSTTWKITTNLRVSTHGTGENRKPALIMGLLRE
jgi:hypothetical protein